MSNASADLDSWHYTDAPLQSVWKIQVCARACETSISLRVSICVLMRVCGWAPCQPLSDSTPSRWRIFVSETNGTERINYHHNAGDMPELLGGGGENKLFPCILHIHPSSLFFCFPCQPMASWRWWHVPTLPVTRPLRSTAGRWHPFQTLPRSHSRTPSSKSPGSHRRGGEGHPAAWKHSSTPLLSVAIFYHLRFGLEAL